MAAHVDAGKTTLTERLLYTSGAIRRPGSVDEGTTQTDCLPIERSRGISVKSVCARFERYGCEFCLVDTPGHTDFAGEVERCLSALDGVILVISAVEGVQSYTVSLWEAFSRLNLPVIIFINKIDRAGSRFNDIAASLPAELCGEGYSRRFLVLSRPVNEGSDGCGETEISDPLAAMAEAAAEEDENFMELYLSGAKPDGELIKKAFGGQVAAAKLVPVLCGSAKLGIGVERLLDAAAAYLPSASRKNTEALSGCVFKLEHDKTMGKIAHVRLFGGEISARDTVLPLRLAEVNKDEGEETPVGDKITQIRRYSGQKYSDAGKIGAGEIAALCGLRSFKAGDYIGQPPAGGEAKLANPFLSVRATPKNAAELPALLEAVKELTDEDPLLGYKWEKTERELQINITGQIQLEVIAALLAERYNLKADFSPPSVIYKETPASSGYGFEAYTMPKPCWAVVKLFLEPLPRGSGVIYDGGKVPHNKLFYKYQTHIRTSFFSSLEQGLSGWEVTDLRATLADGEHHTIHTHPLDFFVATPMALMNGLSNTGTLLLEPYLRFRITADQSYSGRIINDITSMRGEYDAPVLRKSTATIEAYLPAATSLDYPIKLASMTGGRSSLYISFDGYRECPPQFGKIARRRGINPLDRAKWILHARGAM